MKRLTVTVEEPACALVLAPVGIATPHDAVTALDVTGGRIERVLGEPELGLGAALLRPAGGPLVLDYAVAPAPAGQPYPEAAFRPRANRFTAAAAELADASRGIAARAGGGRVGIAALVAVAEARFDYAHPETRFNDGTDAVPYLSCGTTPGSCVDINTYLVASLRAAGYEAAYVYGHFFPADRGGVTHDMHCWVVTRHDGEVLEWDIAHHMKAGLGPTRAALDPRPGRRVALGHSMGQSYDDPRIPPMLKLLSEPLALHDGAVRRLSLSVRLADARAPGGAPAEGPLAGVR
ncbi:transglutaminase domain-containing protein [Rhodosalinus sp. K401]|uniref:transglutaminase domain-containing protein n=1 Tax=Rhodosalinus sp. K401 TaxID=3239195 RepID=UPI0035231F9F